MSHPRRQSQYDDPDDERDAAGGGGGGGGGVGHQVAHPHPHRVQSQSIMAPGGGPSRLPPRGGPPPHHRHHPAHHHHRHHPALLAAMGGGGGGGVPGVGGGAHPPSSAPGGGGSGGGGGGGGFFHPGSALAAAIAAAEYRKQREAAAAAHVFAAAHASGVGRPFGAGPGGAGAVFPGAAAAYGHHHVRHHHHPGVGGGGGGVGAQGPPHHHVPGMPFGALACGRGVGVGGAGGMGGGATTGGQQAGAAAFLGGESGGGAGPGPGMMSPAPPGGEHPGFGGGGVVGGPSPNTPILTSSSAPEGNVNSNAGFSGGGSVGGSGGSNMPTMLPRMPIFSNGRPELPPPRWYDASVPLGVQEDKYYLSELQCVLRSEFVEAFGTTQTDTVLPVHGRNRPIALGQVGIRCQHCKDAPHSPGGGGDRGRLAQNAVSYPSFISGIYNTVQQMYRLHFDQCPHVPDELKERVANLKDSHTSNRGGRKQYWMDSAKRIGLVDTSFGIHYGRDPEGPLPSLGGMQRTEGVAGGGAVAAGEDEERGGECVAGEGGVGGGLPLVGSEDDVISPAGDGLPPGPPLMDDVEIYPLVLPEDKPLISDYLHLALEQMQPCNLMDADRVGCYKGRRTGFPGLACKHCIGQAGCGRYFPASEASLSQTTTSQTIVNHVRNCRRCPLEIREQLELMKRAKTCPDYKKNVHANVKSASVLLQIANQLSAHLTDNMMLPVKRPATEFHIGVQQGRVKIFIGTVEKYEISDKPKHGGRKVFFHRLWCRIQRIPLPKSEKASPVPSGSDKESQSQQPGKKKAAGPPADGSPQRRKRKKSVDSADGEARKGAKQVKAGADSDSDLDEGGEKSVVETVEFDDVHDGAGPPDPPSSSFSPRAATTAADAEDALVVYHGRARLTQGDDPHWLSEADCFIRQELAEVFTAKEEDLDLSGNPEVGQVGIRCFYCAENKRLDEKNRGHIYYPLAVGAVQQAVSDLQRRHLGICSEIPEDIRESFRSMKGYGAKPKGDTQAYWVDAARELGLHDAPEGQGITFFRNPLDSSPADEIDAEKNDNESSGSILVPAEDRQKSTDQMLLLMKQFRPCQFRTSDRKSSRSRDRPLGFPGLVCIHCNQKRYFPITEKKLQDSLSLMMTHIHNCFHAPLDVKASLCYLQHRSLLQKHELPGQWKFTFFKGVWNRLHQGHSVDAAAEASSAEGPAKDVQGKGGTSSIDALPEEVTPAAIEDGGPTEEEVDPMGEVLLYDGVVGEAIEEQDHAEALKEMKDLIKSAALWLSERDAEYEARANVRRGKGVKRR